MDQKDAVVIKQSGGVTERGGVTIERSRGVFVVNATYQERREKSAAQHATSYIESWYGRADRPRGIRLVPRFEISRSRTGRVDFHMPIAGS